MRKIVQFLMILIIAVACNNEKNIQDFVVTGKIKNLDNGLVYLKKFTGTGYETVDSSTVENGVFSFKGSLEQPELCRIYLYKSDDYVPVFVENANISVNFDFNNTDTVEVVGSASHDLLKLFWNATDSIENSMKPLSDAYDLAGENGEMDKLNKLELQIDSAYKEYYNYIKKFVKDNSSSAVAAYVLYKYLSHDLELSELEALTNSLDTNLLKSVYGVYLNEQIKIMQRTEIGQVAPEINLPDVDNKPIQLSAFAGKYVFIDFWASWCPPCRNENPSVVKAFKKYNAKGFTILGVSLDKNRDNWIKAIKDDHLTWTHVSDLKWWDNEAAKLYGIRSIPSNYLIDPKGVIIAKNLYGANLEKKLAEIFK